MLKETNHFNVSIKAKLHNFDARSTSTYNCLTSRPSLFLPVLLHCFEKIRGNKRAPATQGAVRSSSLFTESLKLSNALVLVFFSSRVTSNICLLSMYHPFQPHPFINISLISNPCLIPTTQSTRPSTNRTTRERENSIVYPLHLPHMTPILFPTTNNDFSIDMHHVPLSTSFIKYPMPS